MILVEIKTGVYHFVFLTRGGGAGHRYKSYFMDKYVQIRWLSLRHSEITCLKTLIVLNALVQKTIKAIIIVTAIYKLSIYI